MPDVNTARALLEAALTDKGARPGGPTGGPAGPVRRDVPTYAPGDPRSQAVPTGRVRGGTFDAPPEQAAAIDPALAEQFLKAVEDDKVDEFLKAHPNLTQEQYTALYEAVRSGFNDSAGQNVTNPIERILNPVSALGDIGSALLGGGTRFTDDKLNAAQNALVKHASDHGYLLTTEPTATSDLVQQVAEHAIAANPELAAAVAQNPALKNQLVQQMAQQLLQSNPSLGSTDQIHPGSALLLPGSQPLYTPQAGDTLETIAKDHGVTVAQLIQANPALQGGELVPGVAIVMPNAAPPPAASTAANPAVADMHAMLGGTTTTPSTPSSTPSTTPGGTTDVPSGTEGYDLTLDALNANDLERALASLILPQNYAPSYTASLMQKGPQVNALYELRSRTNEAQGPQDIEALYKQAFGDVINGKTSPQELDALLKTFAGGTADTSFEQQYEGSTDPAAAFMGAADLIQAARRGGYTASQIRSMFNPTVLERLFQEYMASVAGTPNPQSATEYLLAQGR